MLNYFKEKSSLMNGTYQVNFCRVGSKIKDVIREKNGEDKSEKRNEISVELYIVEWGKH